MLSVCLYLPVLLHNSNSLRNLSLKSLFESRYAGILETVRVPDIVWMVDVQVFCHGVLLVLPHDSVLVLTKAMDRVVPGLPVVLGQHVGGGAKKRRLIVYCDPMQ